MSAVSDTAVRAALALKEVEDSLFVSRCMTDQLVAMAAQAQANRDLLEAALQSSRGSRPKRLSSSSTEPSAKRQCVTTDDRFLPPNSPSQSSVLVTAASGPCELAALDSRSSLRSSQSFSRTASDGSTFQTDTSDTNANNVGGASPPSPPPVFSSTGIASCRAPTTSAPAPTADDRRPFLRTSITCKPVPACPTPKSRPFPTPFVMLGPSAHLTESEQGGTADMRAPGAQQAPKLAGSDPRSTLSPPWIPDLLRRRSSSAAPSLSLSPHRPAAPAPAPGSAASVAAPAAAASVAVAPMGTPSFALAALPRIPSLALMAQAAPSPTPPPALAPRLATPITLVPVAGQQVPQQAAAAGLAAAAPAGAGTPPLGPRLPMGLPDATARVQFPAQATFGAPPGLTAQDPGLAAAVQRLLGLPAPPAQAVAPPATLPQAAALALLSAAVTRGSAGQTGTAAGTADLKALLQRVHDHLVQQQQQQVLQQQQREQQQQQVPQQQQQQQLKEGQEQQEERGQEGKAQQQT